MEYKNFDLCIDKQDGEQYPVKAQSEAMGEIDGSLRLKPECLEMAEALKNFEEVEVDGEKLMKLGASLHECLFSDGVRDLMRESLGNVRLDEEKGMRIRLMISPSEVAALPWEVLYDRWGKCFLATSGKTPLTRYVRLPQPIKSLKVSPPVRVLVLIPEGSGLDVEKEKEILSDALGKLETVSVTILEGKVTRSRISEALVEERYHIIHFVGHGVFESEKGYLVINSEDGGRDLISDEEFAPFFQSYDSLKLVVLNSCQGAEVASSQPLAGVAQQLVVRGVPAVVAMQYPISDAAALLFTREFYLKLCKGWSRGQVDAAVSHARNRIHMDIGEPLAFATPVLYMRTDTGVIFDMETGAGQGSLKQNVASLFTAQPIKQINRLNEVKKTRQKNIELLQELARDAPPEVAEEATEAISREREELDDVDRRIARWERTFAASLIASVLIFALGYVGLFNFPFHLDQWLETRFVPYMDEYVAKKFSPDVRIILAEEGEKNGALGSPEKDWQGWRRYHAELIDALARAKAKAVVFDLYMVDPSEGDGDRSLADAVRRAAVQGTRVVVGKGVDVSGNVVADTTDTLKDAFGDQWGNLDVGGQRGGFVRVYQLAQPARGADGRSGEIPVVPSLGLQAVAQFLSKGEPLKIFYDEGAGQIRLRDGGATVKSIPVNQNADGLLDFPYDLVEHSRLADATRPYADVYNGRNNTAVIGDYAGKIVFVGYKTPRDKFDVLQGEWRYGTEIHANVVSNILGEVYVSLLPSSYDFLIVVLMAGVGALVRARYSHVFSTKLHLPLQGHRKSFDVPGLLFVADAVYLLIAFQFYKQELMFILKSYHLLAPFITYWLVGRMRKSVSLKKA